VLRINKEKYKEMKRHSPKHAKHNIKQCTCGIMPGLGMEPVSPFISLFIVRCKCGKKTTPPQQTEIRAVELWNKENINEKKS
jgi:hypothetical protein